MDRFVFDLYPAAARICLTVLFGAAALAMASLGTAVGASVFILLSALAFHAEDRLIIDAARRRYETRGGVKPFSRPRVGPLEEIEFIGVGLAAIEASQPNATSRQYEAAVCFRAQRDGERALVRIASGSFDQVASVVQGLAEATGIPIEESPELRALHDGLNSLQLSQSAGLLVGGQGGGKGP